MGGVQTAFYNHQQCVYLHLQHSHMRDSFLSLRSAHLIFTTRYACLYASLHIRQNRHVQGLQMLNLYYSFLYYYLLSYQCARVADVRVPMLQMSSILITLLHSQQIFNQFPLLLLIIIEILIDTTIPYRPPYYTLYKDSEP